MDPVRGLAVHVPPPPEEGSETSDSHVIESMVVMAPDPLLMPIGLIQGKASSSVVAIDCQTFELPPSHHTGHIHHQHGCDPHLCHVMVIHRMLNHVISKGWMFEAHAILDQIHPSEHQLILEKLLYFTIQRLIGLGVNTHTRQVSGPGSESVARAIHAFRQAAAFVKSIDNSTEIVASCARKFDVCHWGFFFPEPFGNPLELFHKCLEASRLRACYALLVILRTTTPSLHALVQAAESLITAYQQCGMEDKAEEVKGFLTMFTRREEGL